MTNILCSMKPAIPGGIEKTVMLCESQPLTSEGIRHVLSSSAELRVAGCATNLAAASDMIRQQLPAVVLIDKAFGMAPIMEWLNKLRSDGFRVAAVVWGVSISEAEALRVVQAGAQGVIRKTAEPAMLVECLERVASGKTWMEQALLQELAPSHRNPRSNLTPREHQVVELVEQGMKNKEIAQQMGIRPGTVKIHLKHIFEKTGVRGRYGLALSGLKEKGFLQYPTV